MKILNLVTYNILATIYCNKESYPYLDNKLLNHKYRSIQIKKELLQMIQRECVICLQEVNYEWYSDLLIYFNKNNYNLIIESYGNIKNDYMGVAIAHPKDYPIIFYIPIRVKDYIYKYTKEKYKLLVEKIKKDNTLLYNPNERKELEKPEESLSVTYDKTNVMMFLILKIGNKNYSITNYHMPCHYQDPTVMIIHGLFYINISIQLNKEYNKNGLLFMCGDMNTKPNDILIKLLENELKNKDPYFIKINKMFDINLIENKVTSIYKYLNGDEPEYTNYVLTKDKNITDRIEYNIFRDTLDYIFTINIEKISKQSIASVNSFDHNKKLSIEPLPNLKNISDHLFLYNKIKLIKM